MPPPPGQTTACVGAPALHRDLHPHGRQSGRGETPFGTPILILILLLLLLLLLLLPSEWHAYMDVIGQHNM